MAGFTALIEAHGDEQAADLVEQFCEAVRVELPPRSGQHVKTIGDVIMLRIPDPRDAVPLGLHIAHDVMRGHGAPEVRVRLHHGPVVERGGDYFGASVDLAARVSAVAASGEVLLTARTASLAPDLAGLLYESRGRHALRNVREPVELVAAVRHEPSKGHRLGVDPVCRMTVDSHHAAGRLVYAGTLYFFCALECAGASAREPERYVT